MFYAKKELKRPREEKEFKNIPVPTTSTQRMG